MPTGVESRLGTMPETCFSWPKPCAYTCSPWYGPERPKWLGPLDYSYDTYQSGEAPGDYAYDVLQLGREQKDFDRYYELEILHSRWAMLGALGALIPGEHPHMACRSVRSVMAPGAAKIGGYGTEASHTFLRSFQLSYRAGIIVHIIRREPYMRSHRHASGQQILPNWRAMTSKCLHIGLRALCGLCSNQV